MIDSRMLRLMWVTATLLFGLLLSVAPMPAFLDTVRPLWLVLVVSYWAIESPYGFRMSVAWLLGLAQDVLYGDVFGLHGLLLAFVVFAVLNVQQRLRIFPLWQQMLMLTVIYLFGQFAMFWLQQLTGNQVQLVHYVVPALITGLLWPWWYVFMRALQLFILRRK